MKPSFALDLTEEGVTLLHRTGQGWMELGRASFSDPDLPAALDYLRRTAMGLSPKGMTTKLVIPNSQILYTRVTAPGPSPEERRAQIAAALDGRTPYDVADLVYDWQGDGPDLTVAVVARETLEEAESFANEYRFNPVSFVARPDRDFADEPFFGETASAPRHLPKGKLVTRDTGLIEVIPRDLPAPAEEPAVEATTPDVAAAAPAQREDMSDAAVAEEQATPAEPPSAAMPEPAQPEPPEPPRQEPPASVTPPAPEPDPVPEPLAEAVSVAVPPVAEDLPAPVQLPDPEPDPMPAPDARPEAVRPEPAAVPADEAPMAVDVEQEEDLPPVPPRRAVSVTDPSSPDVTDDLPPPPSKAALMAFSSRRAGEVPPPPRKSGQAPLGQAATGAAAPPVKAPTVPRPAMARPVADRPGVAKPVVERPARVPKFSYDDPQPAPPRLPGDPPTAPATLIAAAKAAKGLKSSIGALVSAKAATPDRPAAKPVTQPADQSAEKPAEKPAERPTEKVSERLRAKAAPARTRPSVPPAEGTVAKVSPDALAKGLSARGMVQRGKPRHLGLILTGILLLVLAMVAAWSSVYLSWNDDPAAVEPAAVAALEAPPAGEGAAAPDAGPAQTEPTTPPEAVTAPAVVADSALPPAAPSAAEGPSSPGDEIVLAGMDRPPVLNTPAALAVAPGAGGADNLPLPQMPPPPFGTVYRFDSEGRIIPTPEGIASPDGVMLFAGRPPLAPPQRPATVEAAAAASAPPAASASAPAAPATTTAEPVAAAATVATGDVSPAETFGADPSLASARPQTRPADLAPAAAPAGGEDDASLAPAADSSFASLRPRLRPEAILAAGEASRRAAEAASLAAQAAAEAATASAAANADGSISPLAVAVSRVPAPRPRDLNRAVEAAVAAAVQPAARAAPAASAPAERTEEEAEELDAEEVASAAPNIPTRADVARQATFVNAINLSRLNLIGVYGTNADRHALVRQANGRYVKVKVGDRLDGGTVRAITASEVRYQKGGRLIALAMPQG